MRSFFYILLIGLVGITIAGCRDSSPEQPDILLVTVEGNLEAPADSRTYTERTLTPVSPETLPSAASVLTGLFPPQHGLRTDGVGRLDPSTPTLATRLKNSGYDTAAFLSTIALAPTHGLDIGFDTYDVCIATTNANRHFTRTPTQIVDAALHFLDARKSSKHPLFLWLHLTPYAGTAFSNRTETATATATELARISKRFPKQAQILIVPLFGLGMDIDFRGLDLEDPLLPSHAFLSGVKASPLGIAEIPYAIGLDEQPPAFRYTESIVPWYAFRLPPLQKLQGGNTDTDLSVLQGLAPVRPLPLAHQDAAVVLRSNGHLGEGLVPPYTNGPARVALGSNDWMRVNRARVAFQAFSNNATNRTEILRQLVKTDPDVPLFHHLLGESFLRDRDLTSACNAFRKSSDLGYNMVLANRLQAQCHALIGNVPAAIDRAEAAFLVNEEDPRTRLELAHLLLRTGSALIRSQQYGAAENCLSRALLLEPKSPAIQTELAILQLATGQTNAAIVRLRDIVKQYPKEKRAARLLQSISTP
ncbi:MAG: tetratricopeptide repeat protein [Kiritimatiellia bacterium]